MSIKEEYNQLILNEAIHKYINEKDKNYLIKKFEKYEVELEEKFQNENQKNIAAIIFYNIVLTNHYLKEKKLNSEGKTLAFSVKILADVIGTNEKTLYNLNKKFNERFEKYSKIIENRKLQEAEENNPEYKKMEIVKCLIKEYRRSTKPQDLSKSDIIKIFIFTFEYIKLFYGDKKAIKIKEYLAHVYTNLFLAGYDVEYKKLEELFGEYFKDVNFKGSIILTDGRNSKDFVKIKDVSGIYQEKVYIEF